MISTRVTELLGCRVPLLMGGMGGGVSNAALVSAVSEAGGFAFLGTAAYSLDELRSEIREVRQRTDRPFGANVSLFPDSYMDSSIEDVIKLCQDEGISVVETSGRSPGPVMPLLRECGMRVIHKCARVRDAVSAQRHGIDAVTIVGWEEGGHPGPEHVGLIVQVRAAVQAVQVPVIAGGGVVDGRGLLAVLALGADAALMGTRFLLTRESPVHPEVKAAMLAAQGTDTMVLLSTLRNDSRVLRTSVAEHVAELERAHASAEEISLAMGGHSRDDRRRVYLDGRVDLGTVACGQGVGLIEEVDSVANVVQGIVEEAERALAALTSGWGVGAIAS